MFPIGCEWPTTNENFFGDTAALNVPNRWYAFDAILNDPVPRESCARHDWPTDPVGPAANADRVETERSSSWATTTGCGGTSRSNEQRLR